MQAGWFCWLNWSGARFEMKSGGVWDSVLILPPKGLTMQPRFYRYFLFLFALLTTLASCSQQVDERKLIEHIQYLSSDELEGRRTSTPGSLKAQEYILDEFKKYNGLEPVFPGFIHKFSFTSRGGKTYTDAVNIAGMIPGTSSKKMIVITAHYDHEGIGKPDESGDTIYNGADDNASGTAALLVLADYFSKNRPQHTLVFAALDAEELGLHGAKALVKDFPFPLEQIVVNVNMDMLSRSDKNEIWASGTYHNPHLKPILEKAATGLQPILKFGFDEPGPDDWTYSSDHAAFFDKKIPHVYIGVDYHDDYHKPSDEFKNIQPEFYLNAVNLVLKCVLALDKELEK
jgi:hypothetical protein